MRKVDIDNYIKENSRIYWSYISWIVACMGITTYYENAGNLSSWQSSSLLFFLVINPILEILRLKDKIKYGTNLKEELYGTQEKK